MVNTLEEWGRDQICVTEQVHGFWLGIVKIRGLPKDCAEQDFCNWWPRLTESERERYTVHEAKNVLTSSGFNQLLTYISSANATTLGFSQYFAVGNFPIISVQAGDTSVNGEFFRKVPTSNIITGNQLTLSTYFGSSEGNGTYTNAGLFGVTATATAGSGILMTHTLYSYVKANNTNISNDYIIILQ